jgi:hypothetical protein
MANTAEVTWEFVFLLLDNPEKTLRELVKPFNRETKKAAFSWSGKWQSQGWYSYTPGEGKGSMDGQLTPSGRLIAARAKGILKGV